MKQARPRPRRCARVLAWMLAVWLPALVMAAPPFNAGRADPATTLVVAVEEHPDPALMAGSTPQGYAGMPLYQGSQRARATLDALAHDYRLQALSAWTVPSLKLRCALVKVPGSADRRRLIEALRRDARVRLVEPLHEFTPLADSQHGRAPVAGADVPGYNDPYLGLQHGFASLQAAQAQRWTRGHGVRIALIDTGVDSRHPDLRDRIGSEDDFVGDTGSGQDERHGTEMAGVLAAVANNRIGIVGIAPDARIDVYRACWSLATGEGARCNAYTLAQALEQTIHAGARIVNLSLGGPSDALLQALLEQAMARGAVVIAALPRSGRAEGFPAGVPGVIVVADDDAALPASGEVLSAPGQDILTLQPGGAFDYASGSSLAAAQVSGVAALLMSEAPGLTATRIGALLRRSARGPSRAISACRALAVLKGIDHACPGQDNVAGATTPRMGGTHDVPENPSSL